MNPETGAQQAHEHEEGDVGAGADETLAEEPAAIADQLPDVGEPAAEPTVPVRIWKSRGSENSNAAVTLANTDSYVNRPRQGSERDAPDDVVLVHGITLGHLRAYVRRCCEDAPLFDRRRRKDDLKTRGAGAGNKMSTAAWRSRRRHRSAPREPRVIPADELRHGPVRITRCPPDPRIAEHASRVPVRGDVKQPLPVMGPSAGEVRKDLQSDHEFIDDVVHKALEIHMRRLRRGKVSPEHATGALFVTAGLTLCNFSRRRGGERLSRALFAANDDGVRHIEALSDMIEAPDADGHAHRTTLLTEVWHFIDEREQRLFAMEARGASAEEQQEELKLSANGVRTVRKRARDRVHAYLREIGERAELRPANRSRRIPPRRATRRR